MNSKLYLAYSQKLNEAQDELNLAEKSKDQTKIDLAKTKVNAWQVAVNYLYIYGS